MNAIVTPLRQGMKGAAVRDLLDALQVFLERGAILARNDAARRELLSLLKREREEQAYGAVTARTIGVFQEERQVRSSGEVDEATARALNALLRELGLLGPPPSPRLFVVSGVVQREDGSALASARVIAQRETERGFVALGRAETDAEGRYAIRYELPTGVTTIDLRIAIVADDGTTLHSSDVVRNAKAAETIDIGLRGVEKSGGVQRSIEGKVVFEHGLPAEQLELRFYRRGFGDQKALLAKITTGESGGYLFSYESDGKPAVLEVVTVTGDGKEEPLSKALSRLVDEPRAVLNLVAPGNMRPLGAEYKRLVSDVTPLVGGSIKNLATARENLDRQDLSVLNRATGWDARVLALAATAERLGADAEVKLSPEGLYGLLRAGLPSEKVLLAQVGAEAIEGTLKAVSEAGIVEMTDAAIGQFRQDFETFASKARLALPAPGSHATYGELLSASGLAPVDQAKFAKVYLNHRGDGPQLWQEALQQGLKPDQVGKLQVQGKLAFLTGNSDKLTSRLQTTAAISDPANLVDKDFHRVEPWIKEINATAGIATPGNNLTEGDKKKLEAVIPPAFAADTVEAGRSLWAEDMARKVRLSYPTQVVSRLVEMDTADQFKLGAARPATAKLLKSAAAQGFRLGETPAGSFFKTHPGVRAGMPDASFRAATEQVGTLQRVYQITPSNEAMPILLRLGLTSAFDVVALPEDIFLDRYGPHFPTPEQARLVYLKARQVSSVTYNLFTIAKKLDSEPPVAGITPPPSVRQALRSELTKHFPTMESLFGSMDFCECEHCRSVLSPAAYLVDLLQFTDAEPQVWSGFLTQWKSQHDNQEYSAKYKKPYAALIERRPDLAHVPLTCENTHTALPYIDLVIEVLEYSVAHGKLTKAAARDTGEATTAELLAEPHNVIREAYDEVAKARYPLTLPFDLWSETVRAFCNHFETPLARVLEVFRATDELIDPAKPPDRSAAFLESLGLTPAEVGIFTNPAPLATWHELYGYATAAEAKTPGTDPESGQRTDLNSIKALSRRLGTTYKELIEVVQTGFVNPQLNRLAILFKLGVSVQVARFAREAQNKSLLEKNHDLLDKERADLSPADQLRFDGLSAADWGRLKELQAFDQRLKGFSEESGASEAEIATALDALPFDQALVVADPATGCDLDQATLLYSSGRAADDVAFLKINLFVRLWRRLGWSIEETDRALQAFVPKNVPFVEANLPKRPLRTALLYCAHLKALDEKLRLGKQSRIRLLTLWSDLPTTGKKPLYAQLFLTAGLLKADGVFDHPLGLYLEAGSAPVLEDHALALQGALGLTVDDIARALEDSGQSFANARLSLANVSVLYRYGLLAKALKLSMRELVALRQLSGLDPFRPLHPDPLAKLEEDHPFTQTLRFVEVAAEVKESGLGIEDLDYLLRHRDETGRHASDREATLALLKTLAEGVRAIHAEHATPPDSRGGDDEALRQKLGLLLPSEGVERLFSMMNGTVEFTGTKTGVAPAGMLKAEVVAGEAAIREVRYLESRQEQSLTLRGLLFDAERNALLARLTDDASRALVGELLNDAHRQAQEFFDRHLKRQAPGVAPAAGFLEAGDFRALFDPKAPLPAGQAEGGRLPSRRAKVAAAFLPLLRERLIRQVVVGTMTAHTGADPLLMESLLTDPRLLGDGAGGTARPLLAAFSAIAERGITATFFASPDLASVPLSTVTLSDADTRLRDATNVPLKPAGTNSARLEGYLEVPTSGTYRFYAWLGKQAAQAELRFGHSSKPTFRETASRDGDEVGVGANDYAELKAGVPYRYTLELRNLNGADARLLVMGETLPKGELARVTLSPSSAVEGAERALLLLSKVLRLVQLLGLTEREVRYFLTHALDFDGLDLRKVPTRLVDGPGAPAAAVAASKLFGQVLRLVAYARLKRDVAAGAEDFHRIFEANESGDPEKVYPLIAQISGSDETTVKAVSKFLFAAPAFASEKPLQRLFEGLRVVARFGAPVASLLSWARVASPLSTAEQRFGIARDLKETLKARFEPEAWRRVARPIFDRLRRLQRDALVAHVMHRQRLARLEQLYEHFLIDPGMEPVVQTSRIRLAIASVQLFVERCLLNLERLVPPSAIVHAQQWQWMKRYRVWEGNRKIFLFPENWLEPEFRDDKTHLFAELEGALLEGDVSSDLVEDAFLRYLRKLESIARLDVVAMHLESKADPAQNTLHVIGRTHSQPHEYYYRRYAHEMWTPWEPVSAEIEGDHLAPVVWRDRLYLFWVTFMDKADPSARPRQGAMDAAGKEKAVVDLKMSEVVSAMAEVVATKLVEVHLHWSEYLRGEWSTRESGGAVAPIRRTVGTSFDPSTVFLHVSKEPPEDGGVFIHLGGPIQGAFFLAGRNSLPEHVGYHSNDRQGARPPNPHSASTPRATRYAGAGALQVTFEQEIRTEGTLKKAVKEPVPILQRGRSATGAYTVLPCNNNITLAASEEVSAGAEDAAAVARAVESGLGEIASLMKPLFYQDDLNTLFLEPTVSERTVEEWEEWVTRTPEPQPGPPGWWKDPRWFEERLKPSVPRRLPIDPVDPRSRFEPDAPFRLEPDRDWLVNPGTGLLFDGEVLGPGGRVGVTVRPSGGLAGALNPGAMVNVHPGSGLLGGNTVLVGDSTILERDGLKPGGGGLSIVGGSGLNSPLADNVIVLDRLGSRR